MLRGTAWINLHRIWTGYKAIPYMFKSWSDGPAADLHRRATRAEDAPDARDEWRGHIADKAYALAGWVSPDLGDCVDQCFRIGMRRIRQYGVDGTLLDRLAQIHHDDLVREPADDRNVVAYEDQGHAEFIAQVHEQIDDLCLYRDVKRGQGLVGNNDLRLQHQRTRDCDTLPLPDNMCG